jgi:exopolyphosphatase/guanosine-5'-triphosphate,3'-diphosphate pyrophosphatase
MDEIQPRYEFRVWAVSFAELRETLAKQASPTRSETSQETYLISSSSDKCNAKLRRRLMDIKVLVGTDRGLEQWKPMLKADFPLDKNVIETQVFPSLEVKAPALSRPSYSMEEFLDDIMRRQREISVVNVSKTRQQFSLNGCQAEFAAVTIDGLARDTVAVESADPDAVLRLTDALGIRGMPNTSYIRQIKHLFETSKPLS